MVGLTILLMAILQPALAQSSAVLGYDIIIVAGQSNAVGAGLGDYVDRSEQFNIDDRILQIGRHSSMNGQVAAVGCTKTVDGRLFRFDGLQFWRRSCSPGKGPTLTFARHYAQRYLAAGRKVLIVPAAFAATRLAWWTGDEPFSPDPGNAQLTLYGDMKERVKAALNLPGENRVVAFLWLQGESDVIDDLARPVSQVALWASRLETFLERIREDFLPTVILAAKLSPEWTVQDERFPALKSRFNQAIEDVVNRTPSAGAVHTGYLSLNADGIHYDAQSQVNLGERFLVRWFKVASGQQVGH